ncbi:hypothetical protein [Shewanella surugensis]|uniref:Glutathione S-transferase C-terminal domain-containing protein n=1 Tax=Shewanella surugensis TaxID=212020 RepID=A0ABT0LBH2_9GAMM|nr:hypothetical protein [Shewanella surugensis]MCL1125032.1 hypothetical protein [Shewanella surugensis]
MTDKTASRPEGINLVSFLLTLEERLSHSAFLAGHTYPMADIAAYVMINFIERINIPLENQSPSLTVMIGIKKSTKDQLSTSSIIPYKHSIFP